MANNTDSVQILRQTFEDITSVTDTAVNITATEEDLIQVLENVGATVKIATHLLDSVLADERANVVKEMVASLKKRKNELGRLTSSDIDEVARELLG